MDKRERAKRAKQEDALLNRVLAWIAGAVVLEALLLLLDRYYVNYRIKELPIQQALYQVMGVLAIVFPICFVLCAVWWFTSWRKDKPRALAGAGVTAFAVLSVCAVVARLYPNQTGVSALYVGVPCLAVLALVYYLYQHEFFVVTLLGAASVLGLWLIARRLLLIVAVAAVGRKLQQTGGLLAWKGKPVRVFSKNANYNMLYLSCAVAVLVQGAALALGSLMVLYGVVIVWLLAMAVYYTVRLM